MASTPAPIVDATGIHVPSYDTYLTYFQTAYRGIYGADVYLDADSQDGQFLAILARCCADHASATFATYNAFSPLTAQGTGLSSVVKTNGITRAVPTASTVDLQIEGQAGTIITNSVASDAQNGRWILPAQVVIPPSGRIIVTATASTLGAIEAGANAITTIATVTRGWQAVTNPAAAAPGMPVESDLKLKRRQAISTALPSRTVFEGIIGAIADINGVSRIRGYENDTSVVDADGIPPHAIALVIEGGDSTAIARVLLAKKAPGVATYGTVLRSSTDAYGIPHAIRFFRPTYVQVAYYITLQALPGYTQDVEAMIRQALADWTNGLGIGNLLRLTRAYLPANLNGTSQGGTFEILSMAAQRDGLAPAGAVDIRATFNEAFQCSPANIRISVIPQ